MSTLPPRGRSPHLADLPEARVRLLQLADDVAVRLHALLRERGWSQTDLAGRVGKTKSYVSRVLAGTENLTLKTVAEFEAALGTDVLTVPASEPAAPRRRRTAASAAEPAALADGLPASLRQRLEAAAAAEGTTPEALATLWLSERLSQEARPRRHASALAAWKDALSRAALDVEAVPAPAGFPALTAYRPTLCVTPRGTLVAEPFTPFVAEPDVH